MSRKTQTTPFVATCAPADMESVLASLHLDGYRVASVVPSGYAFRNEINDSRGYQQGALEITEVMIVAVKP